MDRENFIFKHGDSEPGLLIEPDMIFATSEPTNVTEENRTPLPPNS